MNKRISFHVWLILSASIMGFILAGCDVSIPFLKTPTPVPPYYQYTPSKKSGIHVEFDYPSSWTFSEEKIPNIDFTVIGLGDPRLLALPTPDPGISHQPPNDFGVVAIWIDPSEPGMTRDIKLEAQKQICNETHWMKVLDDYKIVIDGFNASVLECLVDDPETSPSLMRYRRTYFTINDQAYEIFYSIADKDRGGEFDQGYDYFLTSLKIVP